MTAIQKRSTVPLLSTMMFLQFFTWGAWFATLGLALGSNGLGDAIARAYSSAPWGAIIAPLFLGVIADRFFPSQIIFGVLFLLGGVFLFLAARAGAEQDAGKVVFYCVANMLCYMPTLGLGNTITFANADRLSFPKIRVWGTIGWIVAGLTVAYLGWSASLQIFQLAGASSILLGILAFFLPHTPAPAKGEPVSLRALLMVDAWKLLARPAFLVFIVCSGLICIPLAYYYAYTSVYLGNTGFVEAGSSMTIGQMSEIIFMLLIPFFFRRLGVKWMIVIGMLAWVLRYLLFAFGAPDQTVWMLFGGIALHGICYDFFFVTGFMYTDKVAPRAVSGQAQSLLVFVTQGLGMFVGYKLAGGRFAPVLAPSEALNTAIVEARPAETLSTWGKLAKMFSVDLPASVPAPLVESAMTAWKSFWMFPAFFAAGIAVLFVFTFWDKVDVGSSDEEA